MNSCPPEDRFLAWSSPFTCSFDPLEDSQLMTAILCTLGTQRLAFLNSSELSRCWKYRIPPCLHSESFLFEKTYLTVLCITYFYFVNLKCTVFKCLLINTCLAINASWLFRAIKLSYFIIILQTPRRWENSARQWGSCPQSWGLISVQSCTMWHVDMVMIPTELKILLPSCHCSPDSVLMWRVTHGCGGIQTLANLLHCRSTEGSHTHNCIDLPRTPFLIRKTNAYVTAFWTCMDFLRQSHCVAQASSPHYLQPPKEWNCAHTPPHSTL